MKTLSLSVMVLLASLIAGVVYALSHGDFSSETSAMTAMPWGLVTIIDLYVGFILLSMWVYWREKAIAKSLAVSLLMMVLGNVITCLYILYAIYESGGSMMKLVNGKRAV